MRDHREFLYSAESIHLVGIVQAQDRFASVCQLGPEWVLLGEARHRVYTRIKQILL